MAQVLKEEIRKKILAAALKEFYQQGYQGATVRAIAKNADIPVGLIYIYYKNKEDLFRAIVDPVYRAIKTLLCKTNPTDPAFINQRVLQEEFQFLLALLQEHGKSLVLLVDKSQNSVYHTAREELITLTVHHIQKQLAEHIPAHTEQPDPLFYHILANHFMEGIFEIARHYQGPHWAQQQLQLFLRYHLYGIHAWSQSLSELD